MLVFESLLLHNFGPYKGFQEVLFPKQAGVVLVVGANMRGKTSFLNAIRFALFGSTLNRAGKSHRLFDLINDEAKQDSDFDMRVVLSFSFRGSTFKITRHVTARTGERRPEGDGDLRAVLHLNRDGTPLPQADSDRELRRILPPELARFFLFDGELLQQYEELVSRDDTAVRAEIIEAIEKALAVPLLLNARRHLEKLETMTQKDLEKALTKDKRYEKLAEDSRKLNLKVDDLNRDILQQQTMHDALNARIRELQTQMEESTDLLNAMREQKAHEDRLLAIEADIQRERDRLSSSLSGAWRDVISPVLVERETSLQATKDDLTRRLGALLHIQRRATELRSAIDNDKCPTCGQPMQTVHSTAEMQRELETLVVDASEVDYVNQAIAAVSHRMATLRNLRSQGDLKRAVEARISLDGLEVDESDVKRRRDRAAARVEGRDGSEATNTQKLLQDALEARGVAKEALKSLRDALNEARVELQRVKTQIPSEGQSEVVDVARAKNQLADHLRQLFAASVGIFRDELRRQVEQRSGEMFLALTSEPDYAGLRINEDYGLEIIRRDGTPVTIRSAGAEHIVAYSLISALQSSSPRPGPVIVDSPFGRLDKVHSHNVIVALPRFSEQVVLLVHENELNLDETRRLLGPSLLKEFRLERRTSSHTVIVEA